MISLISGTREAIGYEVDLAIDCHGRFDVGSAITLAKAVEPLRLMWLEEAVPAENIDAMAQVPRHLFVPAEYRHQAYSSDVSIHIGEGQTISQPLIVALMTEAAQLKSEERVIKSWQIA